MVAVDRVSTLGGGLLVLPSPVAAEDGVHDLRQQVAAALGVGRKQIRLLLGTQELQDGRSIAEAVGDRHNPDDGSLDVSAVVLTPELYKPYIALTSRETRHTMRVGSQETRAWVTVKTGITFPTPRGLNINMMPFVVGDPNSIPDECKAYWPIIEQCYAQEDRLCSLGDRFRTLPENPRLQQHFADRYGRRQENNSGSLGKKEVWYLTIQESFTTEGQSQRREGVHIEAPGVVMAEGGNWTISWGGWGSAVETLQGGIYMASNVSGSCRIWDARIQEHAEVTGPNGSLEHLRELLPEGRDLEAGELVWFTDTTPHQSLPMERGRHRQFVRIVTSQVAAWYAQHSTPNPGGTVPDPALTTVVKHNKFTGAPAELADRGTLREDIGVRDARGIEEPALGWWLWLCSQSHWRCLRRCNMRFRVAGLADLRTGLV